MTSVKEPPTTDKPPVWKISAWRSMYPGMWSWVLQRLSALALIVLFPIHVMNPYIDSVRITMLLLVVWHAMHGIKVILTDFGFPDRHQRKLLWVLSVVGVAAFFWLAFMHKEYWRFMA